MSAGLIFAMAIAVGATIGVALVVYRNPPGRTAMRTPATGQADDDGLCLDGAPHHIAFIFSRQDRQCTWICPVCSDDMQVPDWARCPDCGIYTNGDRLSVKPCPTHAPGGTK
jgi:hypothetical protein